MWPLFKTEMLIYQSKVNLDEKILFDKFTHHVDPEVGKMLVRGMLGQKNSTFHSGQLLLAIKIKFLSLKWTMVLNLNFNTTKIMDQNGMWNP